MTSHPPAPPPARPLEPLVPPPEPDDQSSHAHRQLIGGLGFVLPVLLWLMAGWRRTEGLPRWKPLDSVSAYYYTGAVAAFVGILIALAVFLFTYRGYDNEHHLRDRVASVVAGGAAVLVACFPTAAPGSLPPLTWWTRLTGMIHYASAVVLFGAFIFFALVLFPKSKAEVKQWKSLPQGKRRRNSIYVCCGVAMAVCVGWAGAAGFAGAPIFWAEALALEFFAVSWLAKGRADWTAKSLGRRTLHYGGHPGELIGSLRKAMRR